MTVAFSSPVDVNKLHLYDSQGGALGLPDVTVVGATTGPVSGSLVFDATGQQFTFIPTGGLLPPDTYTITLLSGANGFQDLSGNPLAGNGTPGSNYVTTLTVTPPPANAVVVSIPDFTRGYGQTVNVPASGTTGIPLTLSNGSGITSVSLDLHYDPTLLDITAATVGAGLPAGAFVTLDTITTPGVAHLIFTSSPALSAGAVVFVNLQANVPATATYEAKEILDLQNISINNGAIPALDDPGIHVAAFLGDVSGAQAYSGIDDTLMARYAVGINTGFSASKDADPLLTGDLTGSNSITGIDPTLLSRYILGTHRCPTFRTCRPASTAHPRPAPIPRFLFRGT